MRRRNFLKKSMVGAAAFGLGTSAYARGKKAKTTLTEAQKESIFFMYQEEKVARDVYITLGKKYPNEGTFASIQLSEQRHIDSVEALCDTYGIDKVGVNEGEVGNFVLPELKVLYDLCVAKGLESHYDALKVGEEIEYKDIADLEEAAIGMPNNVVNVFTNLKEGSLSHLDAFQTALKQYE